MDIMEYTKSASYRMWLIMNHDNTMDIWYCTEDIACYFVRNNILGKDKLKEILALPKSDLGYITFIRNLAYRIYVYMDRTDAFANWNDAESLVTDSDWTESIIGMANIVNEILRQGGDYPDWMRHYFRNYGL